VRTGLNAFSTYLLLSSGLVSPESAAAIGRHMLGGLAGHSHRQSVHALDISQ
jgi:hypothetical protein